MYCEQIPVLNINFSSLVGVVEITVSRASIRSKFKVSKVLDFQVIVQCIHTSFSIEKFRNFFGGGQGKLVRPLRRSFCEYMKVM